MFVFQFKTATRKGGPEAAAEKMGEYLSALKEEPSQSLQAQAREYALNYLRSTDLSKVPKEDYGRYWQAVSRALEIIGLAGDDENKKLSASDKKMVRAASDFAYPSGTSGTASSTSSPRPMPNVFLPQPFSWKIDREAVSPKELNDLRVDAESTFYDIYRINFIDTDPSSGKPLSPQEQKDLAIFAGNTIAKGLAWQKLFPLGPDASGKYHSGLAENISDADVAKALSCINKDTFINDPLAWDSSLLEVYRQRYGADATKKLWEEFTSRMKNKDISGAYSMFDQSGNTTFTQFISSAYDKSEWKRVVDSYRELLVAQWEISLGGLMLTSRKRLLQFNKEAEKYFSEYQMPKSPLYYGAWIGANLTGRTYDVTHTTAGQKKVGSGAWEQMETKRETERVTYGHLRASYSHQAYWLISPKTISALTHVGEAFYDIGGYKYAQDGTITLSNLPDNWKSILDRERFKYSGTTSLMTSPELGNLSLSHTGVFEGGQMPIHMLSVEARAINRTLGIWEGPVALNLRYDKTVGSGTDGLPGRVSAILDAGNFYIGSGMLTNGLPSSITAGAQLQNNLNAEIRYNFGRDYGPLGSNQNVQLRVGFAVPSLKQY